MTEAVLLVVIGTSIWVFFDAPARGLSWTWGLGSLALWIVAFPLYLVERGKTTRVASSAHTYMPTPPGWYGDPYAVAAWRWWDGYRWTEHTQ